MFPDEANIFIFQLWLISFALFFHHNKCYCALRGQKLLPPVSLDIRNTDIKRKKKQTIHLIARSDRLLDHLPRKLRNENETGKSINTRKQRDGLERDKMNSVAFLFLYSSKISLRVRLQ